MGNLTFVKELQPQYDRQKSFYRKANVYANDEGKIFLVSYETVVAEITDEIATIDGQRRAKVYGWWSNTTARHVNEFLLQHGFDKMSKKEMQKGGEF